MGIASLARLFTHFLSNNCTMSHCILEAQEPLWQDTLSPFCPMLVIISLWSVNIYGNLCLRENQSGFLVICLLWATFPAYSDFKTSIACSWPLVHVSASWSTLWEFSEGCASFRCCARCSSRCGRCCRCAVGCGLWIAFPGWAWTLPPGCQGCCAGDAPFYP